jgi:hypothetical protein
MVPTCYCDKSIFEREKPAINLIFKNRRVYIVLIEGFIEEEVP